MVFKALVLVIGLSGCVEYKCYPKVKEAIKQAENFCNQMKDDKNLCNKIKIYEKNICTFVEQKKECRPLSGEINVFMRIPFADCNNETEQKCNAIPSCEWTFGDSTKSKFEYPN